jgi:hypothetical protein
MNAFRWLCVILLSPGSVKVLRDQANARGNMAWHGIWTGVDVCATAGRRLLFLAVLLGWTGWYNQFYSLYVGASIVAALGVTCVWRMYQMIKNHIVPMEAYINN